MVSSRKVCQRSAGVAAVAVRIELVDIDLAAQSVAVNAQELSGAGLVAGGTVQDALDEAFFEFADGFVEQNSALHHLIDKPFQLVFHVGTLR